MIPRRLTNVLTVLISLVWTVNVAVGFVRPEVRDPTINAIFAIVVGAIYALGRGNGDSGGDSGGTSTTLGDARRRLAELIGGEPQPRNPDSGNDPPAPPNGGDRP